MIGGIWLFAATVGVAQAQTPDGPTTDPAAGEEVELPTDGVSFAFSNDFELRYQQWDPTPLVRVGGPAPQFFEQVNRFTARAQVKRWGFNVQVDEVLFVGTPYLLDGERVTTPPPLITDCGQPSCVQTPFGESFYANPEKVAVTYKGDTLEFALGDFYSVFGYGAAFALNRNVDIDIDSSVQGLMLGVTPGDWEVTAIGGMLNRQQVFADFINVGRLQGDLRHLVAGGRVVKHAIGPASVGVHGVAYNFAQTYGFQGARDALQTPFDAVIGGATFDLYGVLGADWQFEADVAGFPTDDAGQSILFPDRDPEMGHSFYGAAQFFIGSTVWQVEGKKYYNFQRVNRPTGSGEFYQVLTPPTLEYERAINPDSQAATISDDIYGGTVRMDVIAGATTPYVGFGVFRDQDLVNSAQKGPAPETIFVANTGAEMLLDKVTLLTNWQGRYEIRDGDNGFDAQIYGDIDFKFPLWGDAHADLILFGQRFIGGPHAGDVEDKDHSFTETSVSLTVAPNHLWGVTGYFDYTTNPVAQMGGNLGPTNFGAVEAYLKPSAAWTVRAFYGGYAAGIRCSGGQCRLVPAFTGARIAVTGTF